MSHHEQFSLRLSPSEICPSRWFLTTASMSFSQPFSTGTGRLNPTLNVTDHQSPRPSKEARIPPTFVSKPQLPPHPKSYARTRRQKALKLPPRSLKLSGLQAWSANPLNHQQSCEPAHSNTFYEQNPSPSFASSNRYPSPIARPPNLRTLSGQPPHKKARYRVQPRYRIVIPISSNRSLGDLAPCSSLYFSDIQIYRPSLAIRLSNPETVADMLNNTSKDDHGGIRTLNMARGSIKAGSPSRVAGTMPAFDSAGFSDRSKLQDDMERSSALSILNQVGITELLEQDDRPTFIIDLANWANFQPGPLHLLFANASLRALDGLLDKIVGRFDEGLPGLAAGTTFNEFKAWSISYVRNNESLDVSLPSFFYDRATWTCCSLRKRLRLIRGTFNSSSASITSNPPSVSLSTFPATNKILPNLLSKGGERAEEEPSDYFGNAYPITALSNSMTSTKDGSFPSSGSRGSPAMTSGKGFRNAKRAFPIRERSGSGSRAASPLEPLYSNEDIVPAASPGEIDHFPGFLHAEQGFFDWTRLPLTPALPRHIQFVRSIDWGSTSLGRIEEWSPELRSMCNLIMASPHPAAMFWGDDLISIYNEAYILLAGQKHPRMMGQMYREAWPEIWEDLEPVFQNARMTGQATMKDDDCLFIERSSSPGFLEETYFSWSLIPLVGPDGSVVGFYNPAFEKTRRKIAERRMLTLRELGEKTAAAGELASFWDQVLRGLEYNVYDTPFVLLYSLAEDIDSDASSVQSNSNLGSKQFILEGSLGIPDRHPSVPPQIDLKDGTEFFGHVFREVIKTGKPVLLRTEDGTLDPELLQGIEWRGFGDPSNAAVCCPIHLMGGDSVLGFLVIGVNPRRPYDDDYSLFIQVLTRQLATSMASVVLFEEEIAKGKRAARRAAIDHIELSEQLAARTQEAVESETKFTRMAEFAPVGIFIADSQGRITYCNDTWYEISRVPKETNSTDKWMDSVKNEDKEMVVALWFDLVHNAIAMNAEFRFNKSWEDPNGNKGDTWVLASAYPEKDDNGRLKVIFGSITNISQQKWAEHFEKRRMEEAVEMKRQQENFIDITSHEMRNPLSAILQCADEISTTLTDYRSNGSLPMKLVDDLIDNSIDAAQTIALCAQHQKRIVDDILTLSKLDSALLLVTPCDVMPISVVQRALKMFDGEVHKADIKLEFKVDDTFTTCGIDLVKLDPSRLLQVLINLTTNAIKFTSAQARRVITVRLGASLERPSKDSSSYVSYFPTRAKRKDLTKGADWGKGQKVFIHFAVQDTGRGLSEEETKLLFLRFSQTSPRTHVQYGGSGLGLFISRELVELQGGEIGVSSKAGEGSTFAFYVKAKRSTTSVDPQNQLSPTPLSRAPAAKQTMVSGPRPSPTKSSVSQTHIPKQSFKVIIVEDNLVNQRVLQKQLRNLGCVVYVANHGGECLELLEKSSYWVGREADGLDVTVILMDLEMPVMDGLTCTRRIRELQREGCVMRHVPIIAVSANARIEQIDSALEAGMVSFYFDFMTGSGEPGLECSNIW